MAFISQESIDEVESKSDIVQIINEYVPLTQKGSSYFGCCPFHNEKTPSFSVNPDKKFYYCFGCHAGGGVFKFIQEMEKVSFPDAVELLAKKTGVKLIFENSGSEFQKQNPDFKLKEEYIELYSRVSTSFHYMLMKTDAGKFAYNYIRTRGLSNETLEKFKIGYSPADRMWLKKFLLSKNYTEGFLEKSGLFSKKYPDIAFFSDRLMFPIFDKNGKVVAMGGRFLRGDASKSPKYLNSGDLIQYKKGETLYAFNFAQSAIRQNKKVIFCEGYMDCIAYHQCGIDYAVAPLGTALTKDQIKLIKPFVDIILLSFDSDGAGQKATERAIYMCRKENITVKIICLSEGKDPAEIMLKFGGKVLTNEVNNAILDSDFLLSKLLVLYPKNTPENKAKASLAFFEYIDSLQTNVQRDACLEQFGQTYEIELEALHKDYNNRAQLSDRLRKAKPTQVNLTEPPKIKLTQELRAVMSAITDDVSFFREMESKISVEDLKDENAGHLFLIMKECSDNDNFSINTILNRCTNEELAQIIINYVAQFENHAERIKKAVSDSIKFLKRSSLEQQRSDAQRRINELSRSNLDDDQKSLHELLSRVQEIDKQIEKLH